MQPYFIKIQTMNYNFKIRLNILKIVLINLKNNTFLLRFFLHYSIRLFHVIVKISRHEYLTSANIEYASSIDFLRNPPSFNYSVLGSHKKYRKFAKRMICFFFHISQLS